LLAGRGEAEASDRGGSRGSCTALLLTAFCFHRSRAKGMEKAKMSVLNYIQCGRHGPPVLFPFGLKYKQQDPLLTFMGFIVFIILFV
jgi:hypothetical protein